MNERNDKAPVDDSVTGLRVPESLDPLSETGSFSLVIAAIFQMRIWEVISVWFLFAP
jgi:hypothetical protein